MFQRLGRALDALYLACGVIAAGFLVVLLVIICLQMGARWTGYIIPGSTAYAGYCMAAASFFALAYTLSRGAHIRVNMLLNLLGRWRRLGEIWCLVIAAGLAIYFAWFAVKGTYWSHLLGDISQDQDATPIWIPQLAMAVGTIVAAIAFFDNLVRAVVLGRANIEAETVQRLE